MQGTDAGGSRGKTWEESLLGQLIFDNSLAELLPANWSEKFTWRHTAHIASAVERTISANQLADPTLLAEQLFREDPYGQSEEEWLKVMADCIDSAPSGRSAFVRTWRMIEADFAHAAEVDLISYLQSTQNLSFVEAIEQLAEERGLNGTVH